MEPGAGRPLLRNIAVAKVLRRPLPYPPPRIRVGEGAPDAEDDATIHRSGQSRLSTSVGATRDAGSPLSHEVGEGRGPPRGPRGGGSPSAEALRRALEFPPPPVPFPGAPSRTLFHTRPLPYPPPRLRVGEGFPTSRIPFSARKMREQQSTNAGAPLSHEVGEGRGPRR